MDERVEQGLAVEATPGQEVSESEADGQARRHRRRGDEDAETDRRPLLARQPIKEHRSTDQEPDAALLRTMNPCLSNRPLASPPRRKSKNEAAAGSDELLVMAIG